MDYTDKKRKHPSRKSLTIAIINQKGGVGKSTTAVNLSACHGEKGYKILLVDLDPQGNTTSGLGFDKTTCELSTYECLLDDSIETNDAISSIETKNVWLLPATIDLAGAEVELVQAIARESRLRDAIDEVKEEFDMVIIDCPPSLGLLTINALTAADRLLIPIQSEFYALEGLSKIIDSMNMIKKRLNTKLDIIGVVLTMYDRRTSLAKQVAEEVHSFFGPKMFSTKIPRSVRLSEAPGFGQPITVYDPNGKGAESYRDLTKELIKRYKKLTKCE